MPKISPICPRWLVVCLDICIRQSATISETWVGGANSTRSLPGPPGVYTYTRRHAYTRIHVHTHARTYANALHALETCMRRCMHASAHAYNCPLYTCKCAIVPAHIHACMCILDLTCCYASQLSGCLSTHACLLSPRQGRAGEPLTKSMRGGQKTTRDGELVGRAGEPLTKSMHGGQRRIGESESCSRRACVAAKRPTQD